MKRRAAVALLAFAVAMACFGILARAVDAAGVAQVKTTALAKSTITHVVEAQGSVSYRDEVAVLTEENQVVSVVYVRVGDSVHAGDALLAVDDGVLADAIDRASTAVRKLDLEIASMRNAAAEAAAAAAEATAAGEGMAGTAAGAGAGTTGSTESLELDRQDQQRTLERLIALRDDGCQVRAPHDGTVTGILAPAGSMTSSSGVITLSSAERGLVMEATAQGDDADELGSEAVGSISFPGDIEVNDVVFSAVKDADGSVHLSANIAADGVAAGMTGTLLVTLSSNEYASCLPAEAVYEETPSSYYVYVLEEHAGFLGTELVVRNVSVNVLDRGNGMVALADGALSPQQDVVARADKVLAEGDKARVVDA